MTRAGVAGCDTTPGSSACCRHSSIGGAAASGRTRRLRPEILDGAFASLRALISAPAIFCHRDYARTYLGSSVWAPVAMLHYLLVGERRGWLPNPFFEPAVFAAQSGSRSLLRYLAQPRFWSCRTSERFDSAWYRKKARLPATFNPLADFWHRGFDKRVDPEARFDTSFFRDAVCRDQWDDRRYAFRLFARPSWIVPTNAAALRRSQDAFVASIAYRALRRGRARRRNLLFVQAGGDFNAAYLDEPRTYDVLLNYYEPPRCEQPSAETIIVQTGTKTTAIRMILAKDPDLLLHYESVLFLDDDVTIDAKQIATLFATAATRGLDLAQASLTATSGCFFDCLKQPLAGDEIRPLNAVEIMMPLISRRALERFGWVFGEAVSGWAVDMLLGAKVREAFGDNAIALIGPAVAAHERPVDTSEGRFYTFLRRHGIDAATEAGYLIARYRLDPDIDMLPPSRLDTSSGKVLPEVAA